MTDLNQKIENRKMLKIQRQPDRLLTCGSRVEGKADRIGEGDAKQAQKEEDQKKCAWKQLNRFTRYLGVQQHKLNKTIFLIADS